jgi:predicted PolB exonuclease-like 3'-5' exonuclease
MMLNAATTHFVVSITPAQNAFCPIVLSTEGCAMPHVIVWNIETVPDLKGFAAANGHDGKTDDEIRAELGEKFPKHIFHSIICIGALIAHRDNEHWDVEALGAQHLGERSEKELIAAFVDRIAELKPQLVTFNGSSFDCRFSAIAQWSTKCPHLVCQYDLTFIDIRMTRSIYVTFCRHSRLAQNAPCMSYVV